MSGKLPTGLSATKFVEPYAQPGLDGMLGLTSQDLALALGVQHKNVIEKVRRVREFLPSQGFRIIDRPYLRPNGERAAFVFDVDTAKYLTATWRNDLGVGYFKYLLSCERAVEQELPKLVSLIEKLQAKVAALSEPKTRRIPGKGIVSVIVRTLHVMDMFGEVHDEIRREKKVYSELSPAEQRAYKIQHRSTVMRAIAALQDEDLNPKDRDTFH